MTTAGQRQDGDRESGSDLSKDGSGFLRALRIPIALAWIVATGGFLMPDDSTIGSILRLGFVGLLAVHAVECVIFLPALRASRRPLGGQLLQVLIFGVVHYGILQSEMAGES